MYRYSKERGLTVATYSALEIGKVEKRDEENENCERKRKVLCSYLSTYSFDD